MARKKTDLARVDQPPAETQPGRTDEPASSARWWREAIESIVIAIVLAFLFRTFEAEAFVIPTGSMAPTLQGRHKDVECIQCGYQYRGGASLDTEQMPSRGPVVAATCPLCHFTMLLNEGGRYQANHASFTGDRILVNKFAYECDDPERWDVIVFKYPGNAKQNYIKRLVGLPGEKLRIRHGDVLVWNAEEGRYRLARKPPAKLREMLQPVHDTRYIPQRLIDAGWPSRWQPLTATSRDGGWSSDDGGRTFTVRASGPDVAWLRYRHIVPTFDDWEELVEGRRPAGMLRRRGELISDFYAYNASVHARDDRRDFLSRLTGMHWVGDLAVECDLDVQSASGELWLELVEAGRRHRCRIDLATGRAALSIEGDGPFSGTEGDDAAASPSPTAATRLRGPGRYRLMFANVDDQLLLWVDGKLVDFDRETTYEPPLQDAPVWTPQDEGDLAPVGIGVGGGAQLGASRLRVLRDIYYIAAQRSLMGHADTASDYDPAASAGGFAEWFAPDYVRHVFTHPETWHETPLFRQRRQVHFQLHEDQFFPLGDNSPQSKDGRLWEADPYVHRDLLTGKAFLIYWPHPWNVPIPRTNVALPIVPNFGRMGLIR